MLVYEANMEEMLDLEHINKNKSDREGNWGTAISVHVLGGHSPVLIRFPDFSLTLPGIYHKGINNIKPSQAYGQA